METQRGLDGGRITWNLREAASACGISVAFLRKSIEKGDLRPTRAGRRVLIADAELKRWLGLNGGSNEAQSAAA